MTMGEEFIQIGLTVVQKGGGVKARRLQQMLTTKLSLESNS